MFTVILGLLLIGGILLFGWFDYRRNVRIPNIGLVLVKNRLSGAQQPGAPNHN